jgi:hypothetical protein
MTGTSVPDHQPTTPRPATYRFGPPEQRGVMGVRPLQAVTLLVGVAGSVMIAVLVPHAVAAVGLVALAVSLLVAFVPVAGRAACEHAATITRAVVARRFGRHEWVAPPAATSHATPASDQQLQLPRAWGRYRILLVAHPAGPVGVLLDETRRTATATLVCRVDAFPLLDRPDQERRADRWGAVLATLARDQRRVRRIGWVERTALADGDETRAFFAQRRDTAASLNSAAVLSYVDLLASATTAAVAHECFVSLQVAYQDRARELRARGRDWKAALAAATVDELMLVGASLTDHDVCAAGALPPRLLAAAIRHGVDPQSRAALAQLAVTTGQQGCEPRAAGPFGIRDGWDHVRTDQSYHAVFVVTRCPARDVGVLFLAPLIARTTAQRAVAVVCEPVAPTRARRETEQAITRERGDTAARERLGFVTNARRQRRHDATSDQEQELVDGHALMRFAAYVTVSASTRRDLDHACAEVTHAAHHAQLDVRLLAGQQPAALRYTLPGFCAGLDGA